VPKKHLTAPTFFNTEEIGRASIQNELDHLTEQLAINVHFGIIWNKASVVFLHEKCSTKDNLLRRGVVLPGV